MRLSSNKPTVPGWYWYKQYATWDLKVKQIRQGSNGGLSQDGWDIRYVSGLWAGPIEEPLEELTVVQDENGRVIGKQG